MFHLDSWAGRWFADGMLTLRKLLPTPIEIVKLLYYCCDKEILDPAEHQHLASSDQLHL